MKIPLLKSSSKTIMDLMYQSYIPGILNTAIEVGVFEALSKNELSLSRLSGHIRADERIVEALVDLLITIDLIEGSRDNYRLTTIAQEFLVQSSPVNQIAALKTYSGSTGIFDNFSEVLRNGPPEFNDRMWTSKEAIISMEKQNCGGTVQKVTQFVKEIPEFKNCNKMCDFAGSIGYYSFAFARDNPGLVSHVYDLPEVVEFGREIKSGEENSDRISFHGFDMNSEDSFGEDYDFFFSSHFLYELNFQKKMTDFLIRVNRATRMGGLFVSNHIIPPEKGKKQPALVIVELMTRIMGYPTHQLPETDLKAALSEAGFQQFKTKTITDVSVYPFLLLSAVKTKAV